MPEREFQNLVLMFLNDINAMNKEILKFQSRQLAVLDVIKDNLYDHVEVYRSIAGLLPKQPIHKLIDLPALLLR
jgi:hypothetical protein